MKPVTLTVSWEKNGILKPDHKDCWDFYITEGELASGAGIGRSVRSLLPDGSGIDQCRDDRKGLDRQQEDQKGHLSGQVRLVRRVVQQTSKTDMSHAAAGACLWPGM